MLDFTAPALTTDDIGLTAFSAAEVRVGDDVAPIAVPKPGDAAHYEIPAKQWVGREATVRVILAGPKGQRSADSNVVTLRVREPVRTPAGVKAEPHPDGVRVSWTFPAGVIGAKFRVQRDPTAEATVDALEFIDRGVEMGKPYSYSVTAVVDTAQSLPSAAAVVTPTDTFAPAAPVNLNVIAGVNTIELNWERSTAADLKSYRVYRNDAVVSQDIDTPSFSDKQLTSGERYRYAVTAVDQAGNESPKSTVVEIVAP
jgi:fibronectin type 3 domain-containing protein